MADAIEPRARLPDSDFCRSALAERERSTRSYPSPGMALRTAVDDMG